MNEPRPGFASEAKVTRIIDADTIEVELKRTIKVRLLDCNVPDDDEIVSRNAGDYVFDLLRRHNNKVVVFIPAGRDPTRLGDIHSFERVLGELWIDGCNLSDLLVQHGLAKRK
jgi:endonuclease YncB( thermonuclease family)